MRFTRYFVASLLALGVDVAVLTLCVGAAKWPADIAAAAGYAAGALVHYGLSRRFVFRAGWLGDRRSMEFAAFVASGLFGFTVTVWTVHVLAGDLDIPVAAAKTAAVAASFLLVYLLRRSLVFRQRRHAHRQVS